MQRIKLSLGGGGICGLIHIGVLKQILDSKIDCKDLIGVSAGSIVAGIYASLYSKYGNDKDKILPVLNDLTTINYNDFKDSNYFTRVWAFLSKNSYSFGIYKGDVLRNYIFEKTSAMKFADLKDVNLLITATEFHTGSLVLFSKETTPDVYIADACRASSSIQGIFKPHKIEKLYVENGLLANNSYPSKTMDETISNYISIDGYIYMFDGGNNGNVRNDIILNYGEKEIPVLGVSVTYNGSPRMNVSPIGLLSHTIEIMMRSNEETLMNLVNLTPTKDIIVRPDTSGVDTMDFNLDDRKKQLLIESGYKYAKTGINHLCKINT